MSQIMIIRSNNYKRPGGESFVTSAFWWTVILLFPVHANVLQYRFRASFILFDDHVVYVDDWLPITWCINFQIAL